jgi:hypothetical protein
MIRVRWCGSFFDHGSISHVARAMCRALQETGEVDLEMLPA